MTVDGEVLVDAKKAHGMDNNPSYQLIFELSPVAIVVKNQAGVVLSTVERKYPDGKLAIQDDIPLTVN